MKKRLAVFASGTGTNFEAIARACADGVLDAEVAVMVCDKPGAAVIEKAARYGIDTFVFSPKAYANKAAFEAEIVTVLDAKNIDLGAGRQEHRPGVPGRLYAHHRGNPSQGL